MFAAAPQHGPLRARLACLAAAHEHEGDLGGVLAARARELEEEAALCEAVGGATFWERARQRFAARDAFDAEADALATSWLAASDAPDGDGDGDDDAVASDDLLNARSLLARMRAEIGARRLPFRVVVNPNLASLAATGDGVAVVAGRALSRVDVERTVLHEIEGHRAARRRRARGAARVRASAPRAASTIKRGAPSRSSAPAALLDARRCELGLRHAAARSVEARADFVETARLVASTAPRSRTRCASRLASTAAAGSRARSSTCRPASTLRCATIPRSTCRARRRPCLRRRRARARAVARVRDVSAADDDAPKLANERYAISKQLGEGGQAATFDAVDKLKGRAVVVKRFRVRGATSWEEVELAEREGQGDSRRSSTRTRRATSSTSRRAASSTWLDHREESPARAIAEKKQAPRGLSRVADVERFLADARASLAYLHGRSPPVVHRDIKPGNVIAETGSDGSFVIIDFRLARCAIGLGPAGGSTVAGTFGYMAPEQFQGRVYARRATCTPSASPRS